ncbi:MAG: hypothetical protein ACLSE7_04430 [Lachnospirales bacterium]
MITSERGYNKEMRKMIMRVQSGDIPDPFQSSVEEMEILSDCVRNGYVNGKTSEWSDVSKDFAELRTMDGKMHPIIHNSFIPAKGLAFLHPKIDWKFVIPTVLSAIALVKSFLF